MSTYDRDRLFIDGTWVQAHSSDRLEVRSPASDEIIGVAPAGDSADVDAAARAAHAALAPGAPWTQMSMADRVRFVRDFADELDRVRDELAGVNTDEGGQPLLKSYAAIDTARKVFTYYADLGERTPLEVRIDGVDNPVMLRREPVGVVGIIVPWNSPLPITSFSVAPALLAGCAIVLKPDPNTPLHAFILADIAERIGLPAGVFNVVPADREASEALVTHPLVSKISFTGSTAVGKRIATLCGQDLRRHSLELGGKSAAILLDDLEIDSLMPRIVRCSVTNNGEACVGQTRILVPRSRYDELTEAYVAGVAALRVGHPRDEGVDVGPLIHERQRDRVEEYIGVAKGEGGRLLLGGGRPDDLPQGWYVEPTIFDQVDNRMRIAQEEVFGPVQVLIPYSTVDEAVAIANDSSYGLSGSVWTADPDRGLDVARQVRTGNFGVNWFNLDPAAPFGGFKQSGLGRQLGESGLQSFFELKGIQLSPFDFAGEG